MKKGEVVIPQGVLGKRIGSEIDLPDGRIARRVGPKEIKVYRIIPMSAIDRIGDDFTPTVPGSRRMMTSTTSGRARKV